jgi:Skp family chaperone for outer membrane proteins
LPQQNATHKKRDSFLSKRRKNTVKKMCKKDAKQCKRMQKDIKNDTKKVQKYAKNKSNGRNQEETKNSLKTNS